MKKLLQLKKIALLLLLFLMMAGGVKAQSTCDLSEKIFSWTSCDPVNFFSTSDYWFRYIPIADTNTINVFRTNGNSNQYDFYLYRGDCNNLQLVYSAMNIQKDTFSLQTVLAPTKQYFIYIAGKDDYSICILIPDLPQYLYANDAGGTQIGFCENDLSYPYIHTCTLDERLCTGDSIAVRLEFYALDLYQTDSVVFNMPGNIYGDHFAYIPPTYGGATPDVPVGYNYPTTAGNPNTVCATTYYHLPNPPQNMVSFTTCFAIYVDSIPDFDLTIIPDTVCPTCDGNHVNLACVHISGNNIDLNHPNFTVDINWGTNPNVIQFNDTCAMYLNTGNYPVIVSVTNNCGISYDTAWVVVSLLPKIYAPDTVCIENNVVHFYGQSRCTDAVIVNYEWNFGDNTSISGPSYGDPDHTYSQIGNYTVTLIITDYCGNKDTTTKIVTIIDRPATPIVIGNRNNCDANSTYTIANPQPHCNYVWVLGNSAYSSSFPQVGTSINVNWNALTTTGTAEHTEIMIHAIDTVTGCYTIDTIKIWKCCVRTGYPLVNDSIITDGTIFYTSNPINGTLTIAGNITLGSGLDILMGPEAKIIVTPPYTFTVNTRIIRSQCLYMWDGVYITDSNAKVIIQSNSTVQDALNAIVSENGGKFELRNSKFYNNYISVLAKNNYWGPYLWPFTGYSHKGIISKCTFSSNGPGLIRPYLGQKPGYGIYLDNVDRMQIGDSTVAGNTNIFRNVYCGVYSKNSGVKLVNNNFRRIKPASPCQYSYPEIFTTMYCETAVFSIYYNPLSLQLNGSSLTCGGGSSLTRNTFDTCNMAVYTYLTTTKINHNKIYNTASGVKCRDVRGESYVVNSLFKTNITSGIQFINTLPVLTKVSVMRDSILDPTNGIYLSNITSHATIPSLRSVVSNNFISNAKNSSVYGINLEKCDRIEAYCNKVTRIAIPTTTYRLNIRGIQISQSENALIHDNTAERIGLSIKGAGSLLGTQFKCNTSDGSYNGFYFDAAYGTVNTVISPQYNIQGGDTIPNDNKWTNYNTTYYGIDAGSSFTQSPRKKWYYRTPLTQYIPTEPLWLTPYISPTPKGNPTQTSCTNCGSMSMLGMNSSLLNTTGAINETEIENIINENNNYNELDAPFKYFEKQYAYHMLNTNQLSLNSLTGQYYYDLNAGNIAKFDNIYNMVQHKQYDSALVLNNQILPNNLLETKRQWVNQVYFDYVVPQKTIPQNTIDELEILAASSPFVMGDAVYSARNIVGYSELTVNLKDIQNNNNTDNVETSPISIKVYPNPANEFFTVEIDGNIEKSIKFVLTNTIGLKVFEKMLKGSNTTHTIDVRKLKQGIYIYEALFEITGESINKGRIVIIK